LLTLGAGVQVATIQFNVTVTPDLPAPALVQPIGFIPSAAIPAPPSLVQNNGNQTILVGWLQPLSPTLTGNQVLGTVSVPIPATAQAGQDYTLRVLAPSATKDGVIDVPITPGPNGRLVVGRTILECDVAPVLTDLNGDGDTFDAGEFGDGRLTNADVVRIFRASLLPSEQPPPGRDLFIAMEAAPADVPPACGGDGRIVNSDVVLCFRRSLLPSLPNYTRVISGATCVSSQVSQ